MNWFVLGIWITVGAVAMAFVLDAVFHAFSAEDLKDLE